ncbi:hypothetical protein MUP56_03005, partial [Patescibacteria group bacterium]|nr:hypothetical protein [Patescibacteria group bacterium]
VQYEELVKRHGKDEARVIVYERIKRLRLFNIKIDPELIFKRLQLSAKRKEEEDTRPDTGTER